MRRGPAPRRAFFRFLSPLTTLAALVPDVGDDAEAAGDEETVTVPTVAICSWICMQRSPAGKRQRTACRIKVEEIVTVSLIPRR